MPLAALLLALALRGWALDHFSIWQDEGLSLFRAGQPWPQLLAGEIPLGQLVTHDVHPPLYFALLKLWSGLVGGGTWSAKALSLLASLPTVALVWTLGRRMARWVHVSRPAFQGRRMADFAAILAAFSPIYLWYSQEIRSYTVVVSLGALAMYGLARAISGNSEDKAWRWAALAALASAALVWTHYLGFCLVVAKLVLVAGWGFSGQLRPQSADMRIDRGPSRRVLVAALLAILAALPLLPFAMQRLGLGAERDQHFVPLGVMIEDVVRGFGLGLAVDAAALPWQAAMWLLALVLVIGSVGLVRMRDGRPAAAFLSAYLWVPVASLFVITLFKPVYLGVYHLLVASPSYYVLLAAGLVAIGSVDMGNRWFGRVAALGLAAAVVVAMAAADRNVYADPEFAKDDLRALARYVDANALEGDVLAVSHPVLAIAFRQLVTRVPVVAVPDFGADGRPEAKTPEALLSPLLGGGRLWFMTAADELLDWLGKNALMVDQRSFHGRSIPVRVDAFERRREVDDPDFPPRAGRTTQLGGLQLLGWVAEPSPLLGGRAGRLRLAWQVSDAELPDLKLSVRLLDDEGRNLADGDREPFGGRMGTSTWPVGELKYAPADFTVLPWAAPGRYRLAVQAYDPASREAWPTDGPAVLGEVSVGRPESPVDPLDLAIGTRLGASGGGWNLLGVDLPASEVAAGDRLELAVYAQVRRGGADDHGSPLARSVVLEAIDGLGRVVATAPGRLIGDDASGLALAPGDLRRTSLSVSLPPSAGTYQLVLRLSDADGRPVWLHGPAGLPRRGVWLTAVHASARAVQTELPPGARRLDLALGEQVRLAGYEMSDELEPGQTESIKLFWQALGPVTTDYHVTVQLLAKGGDGEPVGPPVAQVDGVPGGGTRPTSGWAPGEVVEDGHALAVPSQLAVGRYLLIAALYDPDHPDEPRPAVSQSGRTRDFVVLTDLEIKAP